MSLPLFEKLRRKSGLSYFDCAYLCNVGESSSKRWSKGKAEPSGEALAMLFAACTGQVSPDWWDWRAHGVYPPHWRPVKRAGWNGTINGIALRLEGGAAALANWDGRK